MKATLRTAAVLFWLTALVVLLGVLSISPDDNSLSQQAFLIITAIGTPVIPYFLGKAIRTLRKG